MKRPRHASTPSAARSGQSQPAEAKLKSTSAAQIVQAAIDPACSADQLATLAGGDPAFAIRLLAMVNSSAFGLQHGVDNVPRAASLLGIRGMRNLALSLVISDLAPAGEAGEVLLANALRRACACRALAGAQNERDLDTYFTAGLLLESGILAMATDDLQNAASVASSPAAHRVLRERSLGVSTHPESGAALAERYNLPSNLVGAIQRHHDEQPPEDKVGRLAWVAERFSAVYEPGLTSEARGRALEAAGGLGISPDAAEELLGQLPSRVSEAAAAFSRSVGPLPDLETLMQDAHSSLVDMNRSYEHLVHTLERLIEEKAALADELSVANKRLEVLAGTDSLTELPNKRIYEATLLREVARVERHDCPLSLVVIDVDHFKKFNDTWGHATGDEVLRGVARVLRTTIRTGDLAARYGGEEFVLVLPSTAEEGAVTLAQRVRRRLAASALPGPKGPLFVTASFGVATVRGKGCREAAETLFKRADAALYEAKGSGRNRVQLAT